MRAWEIISEDITPTRTVTLRSLNQINRQKWKHDAKYEWRTKVLMPAMYGLDYPGDVESDRLRWVTVTGYGAGYGGLR